MNNYNRLAAEEVLHKRVVAHPVPLPRQRRHRRVVGPVPCAIVLEPSLLSCRAQTCYMHIVNSIIAGMIA